MLVEQRLPFAADAAHQDHVTQYTPQKKHHSQSQNLIPPPHEQDAHDQNIPQTAVVFRGRQNALVDCESRKDASQHELQNDVQSTNNVSPSNSEKTSHNGCLAQSRDVLLYAQQDAHGHSMSQNVLLPLTSDQTASANLVSQTVLALRERQSTCNSNMLLTFSPTDRFQMPYVSTVNQKALPSQTLLSMTHNGLAPQDILKSAEHQVIQNSLVSQNLFLWDKSEILDADGAVKLNQTVIKEVDSLETTALLGALRRLCLEEEGWDEIKERLVSCCIAERYAAAKQLRDFLSAPGDSGAAIQKALDQKIVPYLMKSVSLVNGSDAPEKEAFLFEAAWVLTNLAAGTETQTDVVVDAGATALFIALLDHPREALREQGLWGLGNIAGGSVARFRDKILTHHNAQSVVSRRYSPARHRYAHNSDRSRSPENRSHTSTSKAHGLGITLLTAACEKSQKLTTLRTGVWALVNLCRGTPPPALQLVAPAIPYLTTLVASVSDSVVLRDALWALEGISIIPSGGSAALVHQNVVPLVIRMLSHKDEAVRRPALRIIGQLAGGTADDTQELLDHGVLKSLVSLLLQQQHSARKTVRKDVCWTLSNIAAGTPQQLEVGLLRSDIVLCVCVLTKRCCLRRSLAPATVSCFER